MEPIIVTDEDGVWEVTGNINGIHSRTLVEPSQAFLDRLADRRKPDPADLRREAYPPTDELVVALWELIVEERPEAVQQVQQVRERIKQRYPDDIDSVKNDEAKSIWGKIKSFFTPKPVITRPKERN